MNISYKKIGKLPDNKNTSMADLRNATSISLIIITRLTHSEGPRTAILYEISSVVKGNFCNIVKRKRKTPPPRQTPKV